MPSENPKRDVEKMHPRKHFGVWAWSWSATGASLEQQTWAGHAGAWTTGALCVVPPTSTSFSQKGQSRPVEPPPHCLPDRGTYLTAPLRPVFVQVLYNELDQWREAETKRIKQAECGQRRKLALRELLHKETRLLQTIDRLKITAAHEGKVRAGSTGVD